MNQKIFREYDIRGVVPVDIDSEKFSLLARAFATHVAKKGVKKIALGRDCRVHSTDLRDGLVKGLTMSGINVMDIGTCPTPNLYFATKVLDVQAGIMITGSHNPKEFNGMKMCIGESSVHGDEIQTLRHIVESGDFIEGSGSVETLSVRDHYIDYVVQNVSISPPLKVVVDGGNGTGGELMCDIFKRLNVDVVPLFCEMDGTFPNHHPDPTVPENLTDLISKVKETGADFGVAFDGDSDRIGAVSNTGDVIFGDMLTLLYSQDILKRVPGATIISEVKSSKVMYDEVAKAGGNIIMWKTGHSLIKSKMQETGAALAGEMSGHMFFKERYFGFDDALYATLRLAEIVSNSELSLSDMLSEFPKMVSTPEIRVDCPDEIKFDLVDKIKSNFQNQGANYIGIDGIRVNYANGWGLVRASNTQPVLVLRFEATTDEELDKIQTEMEDVLESCR